MTFDEIITHIRPMAKQLLASPSPADDLEGNLASSFIFWLMAVDDIPKGSERDAFLFRMSMALMPMYQLAREIAREMAEDESQES